MMAAEPSDQIDSLFDYFRYLGTELKVDESAQSKLFAPNFQMIINGKVIVDGKEHLTPHFENMFPQVTRIDLQLHEKIVAGDKVIMRYDLTKPGKSTTKVIAIFKFDTNGLVYEMNEVVHSTDPAKEIDYTSK
jgi:predicted SnoaL-like aldol condensation-catalyzing enzyme